MGGGIVEIPEGCRVSSRRDRVCSESHEILEGSQAGLPAVGSVFWFCCGKHHLSSFIVDSSLCPKLVTSVF